jgi:hypothetical protein
MADELFVVVSQRGEALTRPLPRITAEHFLAGLNYPSPTKARIVPHGDEINEQRLVRELTIDQARGTGVLPACFTPKDGVYFELHTVIPS